jgi:hypothetical protein
VGLVVEVVEVVEVEVVQGAYFDRMRQRQDPSVPVFIRGSIADETMLLPIQGATFYIVVDNRKATLAIIAPFHFGHSADVEGAFEYILLIVVGENSSC